MVLNKQWQADLRKLHRNILFWKNHILLNEYAKHNLTRSVLYSAVIIRKLIDNNINAKLKMHKNANSKCTILTKHRWEDYTPLWRCEYERAKGHFREGEAFNEREF